MAKRNRQIVKDDERDVDVEPIRELDEVMLAVDSLPSEGAKIMLYRFPIQKPGVPPGGRPAFLCEMEASEFSPGRVQQDFGGGRFQWRALVHKEKVAQGEFVIEGDPRLPVREDVPSATPVANDSVMAIHQLQQTFQTTMAEMIKVLIPAMIRPTQPAVDPEAMRKAMLEDMTSMFTLFNSLRGNQSPGGSVKEMFELVQELMDMTGAKEQGSPWVSLVEKYGERLLPLAEALTMRTSRAPATPGMPTPPMELKPAMNPPAPPPSVPPNGSPSGDPVFDVIRQNLPVLMPLARFNRDPEWTAEMIWASIPDHQADAVVEWLKRPDCLQQLARVEPSIVYQEGWWIELREAMVAYVEKNPESSETPTAGPESGEGPRGVV